MFLIIFNTIRQQYLSCLHAVYSLEDNRNKPLGCVCFIYTEKINSPRSVPNVPLVYAGPAGVYHKTHGCAGVETLRLTVLALTTK